jgi:hypothetical protein
MKLPRGRYGRSVDPYAYLVWVLPKLGVHSDNRGRNMISRPLHSSGCWRPQRASADHNGANAVKAIRGHTHLRPASADWTFYAAGP